MPEYTVEQSPLDALAERVQAFEHWVYEQCLSAIDGFVPAQPYSTKYELAYSLLNMGKVSTELLPENVIQKQEQLLKEKDSALASAQANEAKERSEKEQALEQQKKPNENSATRGWNNLDQIIYNPTFP